ncbi:MAG: hypothetical protein IPQ08_06465 [Chitinophagaceae bacterium]|nr:hypothetical protein [Chitinophagaceae bacterium]
MRILLIILLFSIQARGQHYFVIPTMNNPVNKALNVSAKFYQLSRPAGTDVTQYLFGYIKHPTNDSIALEIDSTFNLPKGNITATQITNWITGVYGSLTTTQKNTVTNYINNNSLLRIGRLLISTRFKIWTKAEMTARGWFNYSQPF